MEVAPPQDEGSWLMIKSSLDILESRNGGNPHIGESRQDIEVFEGFAHRLKPP